MSKAILLFSLMITGSVLKAQESIVRIYFATDSYVIYEDERARLDSLLGAVGNKNLRITISGHCDNTGNRLYNQTLSLKRALAIRKYLNGRANAPVIDSINGFGFDKPVATNETEQGRAINRRVDMRIRGGNLIANPEPKATTATINKTLDTVHVPKKKTAVSVIDNDRFFEKNNFDTTIRLKNMNFVGGQAILLEESYAPLNYLLEVMQQFPLLKIRIEGHICCALGSSGFEYDLSVNRAKTVRDFLLSGGIDPSRLEYRGFGGMRRLVVENTELDRITNRRVEIRILNKPEGLQQFRAINYDELRRLHPSDPIADSNFNLKILFHPSYPQLQKPSFKLLDTLAEWLRLRPGYQLAVKMAMNYESDIKSFTTALSYLPFYYLVSKGIDPARLTYEGYSYQFGEREMRLRTQYYGHELDATMQCRIYVR